MTKAVKIDLIALNDYLRYDEEAGKLYLKKSATNRRKLAGDEVGYMTTDGYLAFNYRHHIYRVHRVIYAMHYGKQPPRILDHMNGDKTDNRITNLRPATVSQNNRNRGANKGGSSKYKGVSVSSDGKKWQAHICTNLKRMYLGTFDTEREAALAYNDKARYSHGPFAYLNPVRRKVKYQKPITRE